MLLQPGDGGGHGSHGMLRPTAGQLSHTHCCCAGLGGESKTNDSQVPGLQGPGAGGERGLQNFT